MAPLFHQQCWCWGYDIRHDGPNYLLDFGFSYTPRPNPGRGSSRYKLSSETTCFHLWAFGVAAHDPMRPQSKAFCMKRYDKLPRRLRPDCNIHTIYEAAQLEAASQKIAPANLPQYTGRFLSLIRLMQHYEEFIAQNAPSGHRRRSVSGWKQRCMPGPQMKNAWEALHAEVQKRHDERRYRQNIEGSPKDCNTS